MKENKKNMYLNLHVEKINFKPFSIIKKKKNIQY